MQRCAKEHKRDVFHPKGPDRAFLSPAQIKNFAL